MQIHVTIQTSVVHIIRYMSLPKFELVSANSARLVTWYCRAVKNIGKVLFEL